VYTKLTNTGTCVGLYNKAEFRLIINRNSPVRFAEVSYLVYVRLLDGLYDPPYRPPSLRKGGSIKQFVGSRMRIR